jgi:peptidoglycan-N-acetylglucosamine deacetylase
VFSRQWSVQPGGSAWRPAPIVFVSVALHIGAVLALAVQLLHWSWVLALLAGNHLVLSALVLAPRGRILGPNIICLPPAAADRQVVSLTFDDGPDPEITPRVLDMLERHGAQASFFCVGEKAAAFPHIVKDIVRRGHSVENHSQRHAYAFAFYGPGRLRFEVGSAQSVIARIAGRDPEFFRAPAGFRNVFLDPVLARRGLRYVSWTRRGYDAVDSDLARVLRRLTRRLAAGDILVLHDGASIRTREGEPLVLAVLPALLGALAARGLKSVALPAAYGDGSAP